MKTDSLTSSQQGAMVKFRDDMLRIGLATGPANIENIMEPIGRIYDNCGYDAPTRIWQVSSPLLANRLLDNELVVGLGGNLRDSLCSSRERFLWGGLGDNLGNNLGDNLWRLLIANMWDSLKDSLWDNLAAPLWRDLMTKISPKAFMSGAVDIYWIAHYLFPHVCIRDMHTGEQMERLNDWLTISKNAFWWYPYENIVLVCDRPSEIHKDARGRLHNQHGPAVSFSDGYAVYFWHGRNIPLDKKDKKWIITEYPLEHTGRQRHEVWTMHDEISRFNRIRRSCISRRSL